MLYIIFKIDGLSTSFGFPKSFISPKWSNATLLENLAAVKDDYEIEWDQRHSCGVVIASQGYPEDYVANKVVDIVESQDKDSKIFHAGTELKDNKIITSGGRVFCATALGKDLKKAQSKAYETVKNISFDGAYYRKDIGNKGIKWVL